MKMIKIISMVFILTSLGLAQDYLTAVGWSVGFPYGTPNADYIGNTSYRGFFVEGRKFTSKNLSFGLAFGWNVFNQMVKEDFVTENDQYGLTVSGNQNRSINYFPVMATTHFYLRNSRKIMPFVGVGAGTYYINRRTDIGVFAFGSDNWHFALAPEVGVSFKMGYYMDGLVSLKYNHAFESGRGWEHSFVSLNIGIAYH